jgi:CRP-like cAMP-binding protein
MARYRQRHEKGLMSLGLTIRLAPQQNSLLAAISAADHARLGASLETSPMPLARVIHESGRTPDYVYFPVDCIVALMYVTREGGSIETAIAGRCGLVGVTSAMGGDTTPTRAVVQSAGTAFRAPTGVVTELFESSRRFRAVVLAYARYLMSQMSQTAVCGRHHSLEQQLCRWILMSIDRVGEPTLEMTHELVANLLGVRREGITDAAARLREAGLIEYRRRRIRVIDRARMERRVCECYGVLKAEELRLYERYKRSASEI